MLAILEPYRHPQAPVTKSTLPGREISVRRRQPLGCEIPHLSAELIHKYVADLKHLDLLER